MVTSNDFIFNVPDVGVCAIFAGFMENHEGNDNNLEYILVIYNMSIEGPASSTFDSTTSTTSTSLGIEIAGKSKRF